MNNSILIAIILSIGMVIAVIANKGMDYFMMKQLFNDSTQIMKKTNDNLFDSKPEIEKIKKVWIPSKPIDQCMKGEEAINNNVRRCTNGYYTEVLIR